MARPQYTLKINVNNIDKTALFKGKTATYLDCAIFENDQPDKFGNTHVVYQSVSKEQRAAGMKGKIIGNMKANDVQPQRNQPSFKNNIQKQADELDDTSIPF